MKLIGIITRSLQADMRADLPSYTLEVVGGGHRAATEVPDR
jgi:hypothetical protein